MAAPRSERIYPDQTIPTERGDIPIVSDARMLEAVSKWALAQSAVGGGLSIVVNREPTGVPGEHVTTGMFIELQAALKPERATDPVPMPEAVRIPVDAGPDDDDTDPEAEGEPVPLAAVAGDGDSDRA